jgi:hypothetical protein
MSTRFLLRATHDKRLSLGKTLAILLLFALLATAFACDKGSDGKAADLKIDAVELTDSARDYLLAKARNLLFGSAPPSPNEAKIVQEKKRSAIFLTLAFEDRIALLQFATGNSLDDALSSAVSKMKGSSTDGARKGGRIRIDVVNAVAKPVMVGKGKKIRFKPSTHGLYCRTNPPVALHPLEIVSQGVVRFAEKKGWSFETKNLKQVLKRRGYDKGIAASFDQDGGVSATRFTTSPFIEDEQGKAIELFRWSPKQIEITPELIKQRCLMAGDYLKSIVDESGRFDYRYYPEIDRSTKSYNMLRHCGTTYSLIQLYQLTGDPVLLEKIKAAIGFVLRNHISEPRPRDADSDFLCVKGEGVNDSRHQYCKLGGAGLFLVALSKYTEATGDRSHLPLMQKMAKFIEFMQADDGDMTSKYYFDDKKHKAFKSLFYPGEASYGLGLLHFIDNDPKWVEIGHNAVNWLHQSRLGVVPRRLPVDHWLVISMNELYRAKPHDENKKHGFDIAKGMVQTQRIDPSQISEPDMFGGWGSRPQTSANATRVEGLVAAYRTAQQSGDDPEPFLACALNATNTLVRLQFTDVSNAYFARPRKVVGGFVNRVDSPDIQIDNVQHPLSALLGVYHIMVERDGKTADTTLYDQWRKEAK